MQNPEEYNFVKRIKQNEKSEIVLLENKASHSRVIKRTFFGNAEVYKALLNHRIGGIPKIFDITEKEDTVTVFEEYIDGMTLSTLLQEELYNEKSVRKFISELCDILSILHGHNIIHRDIKPENIMIDKAQNVKLIDFDSARIYKPYYPKDTEYLGTVGYAAPEQYGDTQTDSRTDIYAVGVLMNVLLTGKTPSVQLYSGSLGNVIEKCIQVNPDKRYQTTEELKKALVGKTKKKRSVIIPFVAIIPIVVCLAIILPSLRHDVSVQEDESDTATSNSETVTTTDALTTTSPPTIITTAATTTAEATVTTITEESENYFHTGSYMTEGKSYGQIHNYGGYENCGGTVLEIEEITSDSITFSITAYGYDDDPEHTVNFTMRNITAEIKDGTANYKISFFEFEDTNENIVGALTFEKGKIHHVVTKQDEIILDEYLTFDDFGV